MATFLPSGKERALRVEPYWVLPFSRLTGAFGWMRENSTMRLWPQSGLAAASPSRMTERVASTISACTHTERMSPVIQFKAQRHGLIRLPGCTFPSRLRGPESHRSPVISVCHNFDPF